MKLFVEYFWVGIGGFVGAILRFFVSSISLRVFGAAFPIGTMVINLSGSLFLGWFLASIGQRMVVSDAVRLAIAVGFVGAYTTFSTYMYESSRLLEDGSGLKAIINLLGSMLLGLLAVRLGVVLAGRHA